jgi:hypothetical protein
MSNHRFLHALLPGSQSSFYILPTTSIFDISSLCSGEFAKLSPSQGLAISVSNLSYMDIYMKIIFQREFPICVL